MGYTHYWSHPEIPADVWARLAEDTRRLISMAHNAGLAVAGRFGTGAPEIDERAIALNGCKDFDEEYETFMLRPEATDFDFCKTGRQPYDHLVGAILLRAHVLASVDVRSDGDMSGDDWAEAHLLYAMTFDETAPVVVW